MESNEKMNWRTIRYRKCEMKGEKYNQNHRNKMKKLKLKPLLEFENEEIVVEER